jgi:beta-ureidopropionase / N-carbamoyl-L-amino-acid hydrolase
MISNAPYEISNTQYLTPQYPMPLTNLRINETRFLRTIDEMAQIGLLPDDAGGGRDRRPFSAADRAARRYFREAAEAGGLRVRLDQAANLSARLECGSGDEDAPTLLIGSHLDTVPHGGAYDGALGVLAGLEVALTLKESGVRLPFHLEVVDFTDEEGRFGYFFGSRALVGGHTEASIAAFLDAAGEGEEPADLPAMWAQVPGQLAPDAVLAARRPAESLAGYLELHIEQGPRLEAADVPIGVVSAIFGRRAWYLTFLGRADHAGTTPLGMRADALVAASRFIAGAPERVAALFPAAVVTCGNLTVQPGVANVTPRQVVVSVEFRAGTNAELDGIDEALRTLAEEAAAGPGLAAQVDARSSSHPTPMDERMQAVIQRAADSLGYATLALPSGAGHDAQMLAPITPTGMLFVPSKNGRSHSPEEYTAPEHLVAGANVLLHAVLKIATDERG